MSNVNDSAKCAVTCWIMAALAGLVFFAVLMVVVGWSFLQAFFTAAVIALIVGLFLSLVVCSGSKGAAAAPAPQAQAAPAEASKPAAAPAAAAPVKAFEMQPSTPLPGEAELAARKGEWKYEAPEAEKKAAAPAAAPAAKAAPAPAASGETPALIDAPEGGKADDLKLISGVGPKLEQTLNEMGIWHFHQVAAWGPADIAWVDDRLRFKGRIERDDWMSQAKVLAAGGETEFSKKKKK